MGPVGENQSMRLIDVVLLGALAMAAGAEEAPREWKSRSGTTIEASFVKLEKGVVILKKKDGSTVQAKLDALCDEDGDYVREITYVPQEIAVIFARERLGLRYMEQGESPAATSRDTVIFRVPNETNGALNTPGTNVIGDTTWKIQSADPVGKKILPRQKELANELTTDGQFVFLTYRVKNDSHTPVEVISPVLYDQQGRRFLQAERGAGQHYIPPGTAFAGTESLQPGLEKLFCAFYEMPDDAVPDAVEVFPSVISPFLFRKALRNGNLPKGKMISLHLAGSAAPSADQTDASSAADDKTSLFMRCTRVGQSGDTSGYWTFDRSKKRSLTYGIELRLLGNQQKTLTVKAFFIGEATDDRDLVVDFKKADTALSPGKITRITLQSEEIEELSFYYYSTTSRERVRGAKLKGVIIQVWNGSMLVSGWASLNQWKKFADSLDVAKEMGELKKSENEF